MGLVSTSCYLYVVTSSQVVKDKLGFVGVTERDILPIYHKRFLSSLQHQLYWWKKFFGENNDRDLLNIQGSSSRLRKTN